MNVLPKLEMASSQPRAVREIPSAGAQFSASDLASLQEPVIFRGLVDHWPAVAAAKHSQQAVVEYLLGQDVGAVVPVSAGPASLGGRLFYNEDFTGMNVDRGSARFAEVLRRVDQHGANEPPPLIYLASSNIEDCMPRFRTENDLDFNGLAPVVSAWIGTRTRVAAHNDLPLNIACIVAGKRRFTLFPPDQLGNLYIGPFELTPAGRPISLVDFAAPDFKRFPKFAKALEAALVADMEPGDALFVPSMWWHHVEANGAFNVLINYWWRTVPTYLGTPQDALTHAILTIRDLPPGEKKNWRDAFDYYVFNNDPLAYAHIPENIRGMLGPMTKDRARQIRASLLNSLNR